MIAKNGIKMRDYVEAVQTLRNRGATEAEREWAFERLVVRFTGMVQSCALGFLGDRMQADDAVQETFLTAWRQIGSLRSPEAFPGWLRRIVIWQCHSYRRVDRPTVDIDGLADRLGDGRNLSATMERDELMGLVRELLWSLKRPHREILILHYLDEYSHAELADLLGLSEGAVRKRLHDARKKVRGLHDRWIRESLQVQKSSRVRTIPAKPISRRRSMTAQDASGRTSQEKIDAIQRPKWCVASEEGRLYWDLVCAAIRGDAETLQGHIETDPECARLEYWYIPPIHFAVREGHLEATQVLWDAYAFEEVSKLIQMAEDRGHGEVADFLRNRIGADASSSDLRLHEAVEASDVEEIGRLLEEVQGIGDQRDPKGRTALHIAVIEGDRSAVDALLAGGVDVDTMDHEGWRPAHFASWRNSYWFHIKEDVVDLRHALMDGGAADSPTLAAVRGDMEALRRFVRADPAAVNDGEVLQKRPLSAAVEDPSMPEGRCCPHGSSLMSAALGDDLEVARWLLEAGADPNGHIDSSGTPANRAQTDAMRGLLYGYGGKANSAWGYAQQGDLETLAAILRYCDDPFSDEDAEYEMTPYTAIVSGYDRNVRNEVDTEAHEAMLEMFLQRSYPMPKVLTACKSYLYSTPHMTRRLLEHVLDPNLNDWQRRTPLHDFSKGGRYFYQQAEKIRMFLEFGADIDAIDEEDRSTPLGIAAREGNKEIVELLLELGANPDGAGAEWARPVAWAERRGYAEVVKVLRDR
jgi:RNA polymerase sigma factor (sigma-70 family)